MNISNYIDSQHRGRFLKEKSLHFADAGTSGRVWGLTEGYNLMISGEQNPKESVRYTKEHCI